MAYMEINIINVEIESVMNVKSAKNEQLNL